MLSSDKSNSYKEIEASWFQIIFNARLGSEITGKILWNHKEKLNMDGTKNTNSIIYFLE